jgi:preprotein translocase subunit SecF
MLRILHGTNIDFIRLWRVAAGFAGLFVLPGLILSVALGFKSSVEFTGGTFMQITFKDSIQIESLRDAIAQAGVVGAEPQQFGSPREYVVRVQNPEAVAEQEAGAERVAAQIRAGLDARFGTGSYVVDRTELVGPRVGSELRRQAAVAMLIAFGLTLIYLAWRFEWRFSVAAVLATLHDFLATLAFIRYMNLEISLFVVGAILTVIGYSMNDKVVVFDRVRENLHLTRKEPLYNLLNRSVNETLPRTVMTGSTTLACLLALLVFGGDVIRPFAWVLTFGIVVGTFSSIYIGSPLLLYIEQKYPRADVAARVSGLPGTMPAPAARPSRQPGSRPHASGPAR